MSPVGASILAANVSQISRTHGNVQGMMQQRELEVLRARADSVSADQITDSIVVLGILIFLFLNG